jgi:neurofibromin 1
LTHKFVHPAEDVLKMLKLSLTEFSLPKFYQLFGISKVKSAAVSAFRSSYRPGDRSFAYTPPEQERMSLQSLEVVTDALLEIMEVREPLVKEQCATSSLFFRAV